MSDRLVAVFTPFENLADPRLERTRRHELFDLIVVALCGTIAGADTWADTERFGNERLVWLRSFLRLENGIPSHDTFGRVFSLLDPAELVACVRQWLDEVGREIGRLIAIDGKTLRGSFDTAARRSPLHLVSAWASEARLTLGQVAVDCKSNEITAVPLLLELLELKGATVTLDAMGCQKEIAQKSEACRPNKRGERKLSVMIVTRRPGVKHLPTPREFLRFLRKPALGPVAGAEPRRRA